MNKLKNLSTRTKWVLGVLVLAGLAALPLTKALAVTANCDSNAIIWCGAQTKQDLVNAINNGDGHNSAANIQQIYSTNGLTITPTSVMSSDTVDGTVDNKGNVTVNGQIVATNVWSVGRTLIGNSQPFGSVWMRPTSVSFLSPSLDAFVNMSGGTFHWAVLKACGNPVIPTAAPFGQIFKRVTDVTKDPNTKFAADDAAHAADVNSGDTLRYDVTITNNGTSDMSNIVMTDNLPAGVTLISNPSLRDISTTNFGTIAANQSKVFTITVKATSTTDGDVITNKACFTADQNQSGCDTAVIKIHVTTPVCTTGCTTTQTCTETNTCIPPTCATTPCATTQTCTQTNTCTPTTLPTTPPTTPLPQTGVADAAAPVFGTGIVGYAGYAYLRSKRALLAALRNIKK